MKKLIIFLFLSVMFLSSINGQWENVWLDGPETICSGECGTYVLTSDAQLTSIIWRFNDVVFPEETSTSFTICGQEIQLNFGGQGTVKANTNFGARTVDVEVIGGELITISDNICEDEETDCRQVCVGQTTQSTISQTGEDLNWTIEGSEDYEINGNTASVTWNEVGEGSVEVNSNSISDIPLNIYCHRSPSRIYIEGGVYPIVVVLENLVFGGGESFIFNEAPENGYFTIPTFGVLTGVTVTDATGDTDDCSIYFSDALPAPCNTVPAPSIIASPTDCTTCNGVIGFSSGAVVEWLDGSTENYRDDLCPGNYTVTVYSNEDGITACQLPTITLTDNLCETSSSTSLTFNAGFYSNEVWWAQIEGGIEPYTLTITDYLGMSFDFPFSQIGNIFTNGVTPLASGPGEYTFMITDGTGQEITFTRTAPDINTAIEIPSIISSVTECDICDGILDFNAFGGGNYIDIYEGSTWIAGGTNLYLDYLCPGEHRAIVFEDITGSPPIAEYPIIIGNQCTTTTPTASCPISATQCIQVLPNPEAQFVTLPAAADNVVEICNQQSINFQNESTGAESFIWDFGDFNTSVSANPEHIYTNPGTYNVTCIARNDCFCSDTTSLTVNVLAAEIPEIECVGTVCAGDTVTYTSPADCNTFAWQISAEGNLFEGGGLNDNFAQVVWGSGPVGTVALSVGNCGTNSLCSQANVAQIPILSGDAVIEGPSKVYNSTQVIYSIPKYDGTDFQWTVSEFGTITSGENTHQITVMWEGTVPNDAQSVEVIYENCWLECGGNTQMDVSIVPEFYIQGVPAICENESSIYYARETANDSPANVNWAVLNAEGTTVFTASDVVSVMIPFEYGSGEYIVSVTPADINDYCTSSYDLKVQVSELPNALLAINGQSQICLGETYTYNAQSELSNPILSWTVNDAGNITSQMGTTAVVTWQGEGVHSISATQTNSDGLSCTSESITFNVETVPSIVMSGTPDICAESTANYTATDLQGVSYDWSITPENAGTIINGNNTNSIEIYWAYGGNATVNLQLCGQNLNQNVDVNPFPSPQAIYPDYLCPDQTTIVSLTQNYQSYLWKDETGMTISTEATADLTSGYYEIEVVDADGCIGNSVFNIGNFIMNDLNISTGSFTAICPAAGIGFPILYAPELEEGFTYEWFFNGISLSLDATQIQTTDYGTYSLEATNPDGCLANSNEITISNACGQGPPAPPGGCNLSFSFQNAGDCKTFDFMPTSGNVISIVNWDFGDGNSSTEMNPQHTYDEIGLYHIVLIATVTGGNGMPVTCLADMPLTFPVVADFGFNPNCAGEAVQFNDISLTVGEGEILSHNWNFGDSASDNNTSNETNPSHAFSSPGTYSISLIVTDATGCSDEKLKTITVLSSPTVDFNVPDQTCAATALPFTADVSSTVVNYNWNFGDPASGNANTAQSGNVWHNYENVGVYDVTLTGSDIYGCEDEETQTVVTEPNSLTGNINVFPANTICEGDNVSLSAPEGGNAWQWSTGDMTENITVSEAGNYQVTLTDANGCTYIPTGQIIEVLPLPSGDIYALDVDEYGNPINYVFETYEVCYGEDVFLQIEENELYSYEWSTGSSTTEEEFSEDRDNILEVGTTDISVTISDLLTGCSSISTYSVIVHPQPENIVILSDTPSPICGNSSANLMVENPNTDLNYIWNTGELGPQITLIAGGEYWVRAINEFGCEGESNHITVENAPDINKVPDGCHMLCESDTLCLPSLENITVYQWYLNGEILTGETATTPDLIMNEDGEYQLFMEDIYGCTSWSDPLNVEFYEGQGTVYGQVWLDVNENGIIDAGDENLSGINIQITDENGFDLDNISINEGFYSFQNIPTTDYTLSLDTLSLPPDVTYTVVENTAILEGCADEEMLNWLLSPYCAPLTETLEIPSCDGISAFYNDTEILVGESQDFAFIAIEGCDSILTVIPYIFTPDISTDNVQICEDETIEINGISLQVGDVTDILFMNQLGCDSIVTYTVLSANSSPTTDEISICEEETIEINGISLQVGDVIEVPFTNQLGCDSMVTYTALSANSPSTTDEISICEGEMIEINGLSLQVGDLTDVLFTNLSGCDSIVTYTVLSANSTPTNQSIQLCEGESIEIEGNTINAGETIAIQLTNQAGCDSVITITAGTLSPDFTTESVQICEGEIYEYQNTEMLAGETQIFTLINQNGCDSLIEMTVNAFAAPTFSPQSSMACPDINDGSFVIGDPNGGVAPFEYSLNGNEWQTNPEFTELYSGNYIVQIRDANACIYEENIEILSAPDLVLIAEDQVFPCAADEIELEVLVSGGIGSPSFSWNTGDSTISILIEEIGTYSLIVSNECYEESTDIEVIRGLSDNTSTFYIPNAFSPNSDGVNDKFCALSADNVEVLTYHLMVFDRWGNFVYESFAPEDCWDGIFRGKAMNNAVFMYVLEAEVLECEEQKRVFEYGDVTIVR